MRDIFDDILKNTALDPVEAARRPLRPHLRRRFYKEVRVAEGEGGFALALDDRSVRTPARRPLVAPERALAEALATEWRAQTESIDPAQMPLTRLANSIIDGVTDAVGPVKAEIEKYLHTDLLFYRAESPAGLVARQAAAWDPLLAWAREALDARFVVADSLVFVAQPAAALAAAGAAIPQSAEVREIWRLGALHSITTLTGSALIALALLHGRVTVAEAWAAAHVDEDWNLEQWGRDEIALQRRAFRHAEMEAAARVLILLNDPR
jgi:chaperone required for assembly of F1-ATPase